MAVLFWITIAIAGIWTLLFFQGLLRLRAAPRVRPVEAQVTSARVSVIVPARNEEDNIGQCLRSLLAQHHRDLEIIVVDDKSTDRTAEIVRAMAALDERVRLVSVRELPPGWTGKCNAMHQGVTLGQPTGQWLLFTDADTRHDPRSVGSGLQAARQLGIDFLTLVPHLEAKSFWEKLMQPTMATLIALFQKPERINDPSRPEVFANGQYMLVRTESYRACGGHESLRGKVLDDSELARAVVRGGGRMYLAMGRDLFATRMYCDLRSLVEGWTKNFYMILESRVSKVLGAALLALVLSTWPAVFGLAAIAALATDQTFWPEPWLWAAAAAYGVVLCYQSTLRAANRWYPAYAVLAPLANLIAVYILLRSTWLHRRGQGVSWKGRDVFDQRGDPK